MLNQQGRDLTNAYPSEDIIPERAFSIGWKPTWNNDRFLQNINDEIEAVIQLGSAKSSLIESFLKAGEGN